MRNSWDICFVDDDSHSMQAGMAHLICMIAPCALTGISCWCTACHLHALLADTKTRQIEPRLQATIAEWTLHHPLSAAHACKHGGCDYCGVYNWQMWSSAGSQ